MTITAKFEIEYHQYLNHEGNPTQSLPQFAHDLNTLQDLYYWMTLTRALDNKAVALQRTGKLGTYPASLGQEAVTVGMGHALADTDVFVPYYRDQGTLIQRGAKLSQIFAYWGGDERGSAFAKSEEDFPICVPIATQLLHAAGIAYAIKLRKQSRAVLSICGDGGTSEGDFYEAINFAGTFQLPVVFIINNNQWAISVPLGGQTGTTTLAQKAIAGGFRGIQVDGNDVIAMKHCVEEALAKARNGGGPTLIEAITYRLCDHTTADDARRYVNQRDLEIAWQYEPLIRLRQYLTSQNAWSEQDEDALQAHCSQEINAAVDEYLGMSPQPSTAIFDYLYAELPAVYQSQRDELLTTESSSH